MYLAGASHPNKERARRLLERLVSERSVLVTSAEVFQELLHRYSALRPLDAVDPAFQVLRGLTDHVFGIELADVELAATLLGREDGLSARAALHVAVMRREGIDRILSFDSGFDGIAGLERLHD